MASGSGHEYRCPMHPEVVADSPGKCPKCGMALERVVAEGRWQHRGCEGSGLVVQSS